MKNPLKFKIENDNIYCRNLEELIKNQFYSSEYGKLDTTFNDVTYRRTLLRYLMENMTSISISKDGITLHIERILIDVNIFKYSHIEFDSEEFYTNFLLRYG